MRPVLRLTALAVVTACSSTPQPAPAPSPAPPPAETPVPPLVTGPVGPVSEVVVRFPRSGAGIMHYVLRREDSVLATMPSGEEQLQLTGRTAYLTLTWIAGDTGTRITAAVDSLIPDTGFVTTLAVLDSVRGARWSGFRRPNGALTGVTGSTPSLLGDQIRDQLVLLFPLLPAEGARANDQWTDSTDAPVRVSAFETTETALTEAMSGPVDFNGNLPLAVVRNRTATGEGTQFGQPINVSATGSDTLSYVLTPDGRVVEAFGGRVTDIKIDLPAVGQSVLAREVSRMRMTLQP